MNVQAKRPVENSIIGYAAETYKYWEDREVIFDGSAFDFLVNSLEDGVEDVYEQIALSSLANLTYIVVITMDMDKDMLELYKGFAEVLPDKFYFYNSYTDFELVLR